MTYPYIDIIINTLVSTAKSLIVPALIFFLLSLLINKQKIFEVLKKCSHASALNLSLMAFNIVLMTPIFVYLSNVFNTYKFTLIPTNTWIALPDWIVVIAVVFCGDFIGYWRHRFEHSRLLWPSHIVHHSDAQMTWLTLERFHPINRLTTFTIDGLFLLALGFPAYAIVANNLVRHYYGFLIHANLPLTYGWLSMIFVSPAMHRWHHAVEPRAHHTNYATVFSVFDRAFGTYRVPGVCNVPLGVDAKIKQGFWGQLTYAFKYSSYKDSS